MNSYIKNKIIPIGIIIFVIISIIIISTYALSIWSSSENTELTMKIGDVAGVYFNTGPNINLSNLGPVVDYEQYGEASTFSITNYTSGAVSVDINLIVTSISDNLKEESFKYVLMSSTNGTNYTKISEGNFQDVSNNDSISLQSNYRLSPSTTTYFKVIIFIDGNMNNPTTMQNGSFSAILSISASEVFTPEQVLANLGLSVSSGTPDFSGASCNTSWVCHGGSSGIYSAEDDLGTSYYFRGDLTNNYVKFGKNESGSDMYWRIIRINGDGTVRMIYDGTQAHNNGTSSTNRYVTTSVFNSSLNDNTYVGYMYGDTGQSTYASTHTNKYNSTIKTYLEGTSANNYTDGWYYKNIVATGYADYVADAIYCNDRSLYSGSGYAQNSGFYGGYNRLYANKTPTLKCDLDNNTTKRDSFTVNTNLGNGLLKYPVGLITADEIAYAGGIYRVSNESMYLSGESTWTMSPFFGYLAYEWRLASGGSAYDIYVNTEQGVRPVVNLRSGVEIIDGDGTSGNPYVIKTN